MRCRFLLRLRGHFSRIEHQQQGYFQRPVGHVLRAINLQLPPGIHDVYYYDLIGNVSTSRLRETPSIPKGAIPRQNTFLEIKPRYPIVGGWNYSFTLGWDSPLRDSASYDPKDGTYTVAVPIMTQYPDVVVQDAELNVILPEGAIDVQVSTPFPAKATSNSTHTTYLDSIGRPVVTLQYESLTDRHLGVVYVSYKVPLSAHLKKPVTIAAWSFALFTLASVVRRLDLNIHKKY